MPRFRHLLALALSAAALIAPTARGASSDLVVSQFFAGGGNASAPYANDFVELFNRGATTVDLAAWSIQYASAASVTWQATSLAGSIQPGRHYLVQLASGGTAGGPLPTADATGTSNLATSGGKVLGGPLSSCRNGGSVGSDAHAFRYCRFVTCTPPTKYCG